MSDASPRVAVVAPGTSRARGAPSSRRSAMAAGLASTAARATRTFTKSTYRQLRSSVIMPPPTMPTTNPRAAIAP
jgi:hypothetical protein